jgi:ABC-type branched-subunit amino acid transport system substrate-binding protein
LSKAKELDDADDNKTLSKNVAWFGADSITQSPAFLSGTPEANTAASFFVTTNMQSTLFALAPSHEAKFEEFSKRVMTEKQFQPNTYEGNFYDAIQALGETAVALGSKEISFTDLLTAFLDKTKTLEGVTGLLALDESCDRASSAYDFFTLQKSGDTYSWVKTKKQVPE